MNPVRNCLCEIYHLQQEALTPNQQTPSTKPLGCNRSISQARELADEMNWNVLSSFHTSPPPSNSRSTYFVSGEYLDFAL